MHFGSTVSVAVCVLGNENPIVRLVNRKLEHLGVVYLRAVIALNGIVPDELISLKSHVLADLSVSAGIENIGDSVGSIAVALIVVVGLGVVIQALEKF
jgi:hypothetical protein